MLNKSKINSNLFYKMFLILKIIYLSLILVDLKNKHYILFLKFKMI
jgi:hypothetical protein